MSRVDAAAVVAVREAVLLQSGIDRALGALSQRYPAFWAALFAEALRRWLGPHCDIRAVSAFARRVAARVQSMEPRLAARNAEVIIRVVLGEHDLGSAITPARGLEQVLDAILPELFEEIQPGLEELDELLGHTEMLAGQVRTHGAQMIPAYRQMLASRTDRARAAGASEQERSEQTEQLAGHPGDVKVLGARALALNAEGRHLEALACYDRALGIAPADAALFADRGGTYLVLGQLEEALADYRRAVTLTPDSVDAIAGLGNAYRLMDRYDEALAQYDRAIRIAPGDAWVLAWRGLMHRRLEQQVEALADFSRAIAADPANAWMLASRGETYLVMERYEEALADLNSSIMLDSDSDWALAVRGDIFLAVGRHEEALRDYTRAIALDPEDASWFMCRGQIYREMGNETLARADFLRAVEIDPDPSR